MKFDGDKLQFRLLPPFALEEVAKVLTFGAKKYAPENWRKVADPHNRYMDAALRHLNAHLRGEIFDTESRLPHIAHAICCLLFIQELNSHAHAEDQRDS